jgi:hypothetical protein
MWTTDPAFVIPILFTPAALHSPTRMETDHISMSYTPKTMQLAISTSLILLWYKRRRARNSGRGGRRDQDRGDNIRKNLIC